MKKVKNYIVYSTPACVYCGVLKEWLTKNSINYEEIDVASNPARGQEMIQKTGQMGVPVSIITLMDNSEEVVLGFNQNRLKELLGINS